MDGAPVARCGVQPVTAIDGGCEMIRTGIRELLNSGDRVGMDFEINASYLTATKKETRTQRQLSS
jgi:hypothetical protein